MSSNRIINLPQSLLAVVKRTVLNLNNFPALVLVLILTLPISGSERPSNSHVIEISVSGATIRDKPISDPLYYTDAQSGSQSWNYTSESGDTLGTVSARFQVKPADIQTPFPVTEDQLLDPGTQLVIPRPEGSWPSLERILPDSEVVYSPGVLGFDTPEYVNQAGGYLSTYTEYLRSSGYTSGAEIVERVAMENSINPRLLLALLEYRCGCVSGPIGDDVDPDYLMGVAAPFRKGLYRQLGWVVNQLSQGYYGWRRGLLNSLHLSDGSTILLPPDFNAGSASLAYFFSNLFDQDSWDTAMNSKDGFKALYQSMFDDPPGNQINLEQLFPPRLTQPDLILPFQPDEEWGFTSGPHNAWETEGALAALDFAPATAAYGCLRSNAWVVAVADGLVVRSEHGAVVLDLDQDGFEGTGWAVLYMHLESRGRVEVGSTLRWGDPVGHPSCEGGPADGTHVHIARKYNGEWIAADGPLPFVMSGWVAHAGYRPFEGSLTRDRQTVVANSLSPAQAFITRSSDEWHLYAKNSRDMWWEE